LATSSSRSAAASTRTDRGGTPVLRTELGGVSPGSITASTSSATSAISAGVR
jgi:hypothetical protein